MRYQDTLCMSHPILEGRRRGIIASDVPEHPEHIAEACLQALPESHPLRIGADSNKVLDDVLVILDESYADRSVLGVEHSVVTFRSNTMRGSRRFWMMSSMRSNMSL